VALRSYKAGLFADLSLDANPNSKLGDWSCSQHPITWHGTQDWLQPKPKANPNPAPNANLASNAKPASNANANPDPKPSK
ncbi:MAG: hypothetical protein ACI4B6_00125, partial [Atopobiaceae bacterium]